MNELETLTRHISCKCKFKFDSRKSNSNQNWYNNKGRCECQNLKEHNACEKHYVWNPPTYSFQNVGSFASAIEDSVIL